MMFPFRLSVWLIAGFVFALPVTVQADISLPQIFSDNMVFQRDTKARIYGTAEPKQRLKVELAGVTLNVAADEQGVWSVFMPVGSAGGPHKLIVTAEEGQPQVKLNNVMFGEVWLCSGQSNMQWPVAKVLNSTTEIEQSINFPKIRLFTVVENVSRQPLDRFEKVIGWDVCSPDSVGQFSGTAYFFARELSKKFPDVPIGLIDASWGGTACEAWISGASYQNKPEFDLMLEHWESVDAEDDRNRPTVLFNGMISPLRHFRMRGVIWYQGERNNGRGEQYGKLFPLLIQDWRTYFKDPTMPFYFVQLAPFRYRQKPAEGLAEIWDAQLNTLRNVPHTGMVVTTDIGNVDDIHPKNKQEVGRRLSLIAIANLYNDQVPKGETVEFSGPIFEGYSENGRRVRLTFKHAAGLKIRGDEKTLTHFTICGEDQKFVPAVAKIVGETVELYSEQVDDPVAVRFGWSDTAQPNLINGVGLPASPFRTDNFDLQSKGREF